MSPLLQLNTSLTPDYLDEGLEAFFYFILTFLLLVFLPVPQTQTGLETSSFPPNARNSYFHSNLCMKNDDYISGSSFVVIQMLYKVASIMDEIS